MIGCLIRLILFALCVGGGFALGGVIGAVIGLIIYFVLFSKLNSM